MHIVAVAWLFVVGLMTLAEATSSQGTLLGALITLLLYGLLPLALVLYLMGTPARRRAQRRAEQAAHAEQAERHALPGLASAQDADRRAHAAGQTIAPEREEP